MSRYLLPLLLLTACDPLALGTVVRSHPCVGNRTDTLWADSDEDVWVGCGSTTSGTGLFTTTDAGRSWQAAPGFDSFRVSHLHRAPDGVLYVAGTDVGGEDRVRTADGEPVFVSTSQTWNNYHVGSFVQLDDGTEIAESLTGTGLAWRSGPQADWTDGSGWPLPLAGEDEAGSYQILDLVQFEGDAVGVGSTITQPPTVFVRVSEQDGPLRMQPVVVDPGVRGEIWGVDADAGGIVAAGVDQDASVGRIYVLDAGQDPTSAAAWQVVDVGEAIDGDTWMRAACREGSTVVAVGENPRTRDGVVMRSEDGGVTFSPATPYEAPALSACDIVDGQVIVAGAQGWIGWL